MAIQNDIAEGINKAKDTNIDSILKDVASDSGFKPERLINESRWWNSSQVGALHYSGTINGKPSILKLQLVKVNSPEVTIIENYHKHNKSSRIRAPYIYYFHSWDDSKNYEALIMEKIEKNPVVHYPTNPGEVESFHSFFRDYKMGTDFTHPWIEKPSITDTGKLINEKFAKWRGIRSEGVKNSTVITDNDELLIQKAVSKLAGEYDKNNELVFMHGHFGPQDLHRIDKDKAVIFSNLYWSWRYPYYDLVFGYHYYKFFLVESGIDDEKLFFDSLCAWYNQMLKTANELGDFNEYLFNLALLERLTAGLNLDYLNIEPSKPLVDPLINVTREELANLLEIL